MKLIEICVHCYKYSKLLNLQLSSYFLHGGKELRCIKHIIYTCKEDILTNEVCDFFKDKINLEKRLLPKETLAARGYGRDLALRKCDSDWIWFADADHLISDGFLYDLLNILYSTNYKFLYPSRAIKNKHDEDIDNYLNTINVPDVIDFNFEKLGIETTTKKHRCASGGVQIFKSEYIKKCGYNYKHKFHTDWVSCLDDRRARKKFNNMFPKSISPIIVKGHRHLTHKTKRRNDHSVEL